MGDLAYKQEPEGTSHLYRMVLKPDNTVKVDIDEENIYEGSIKEDWEVLLPKEITDPEDKKPDDWSDESMIDDPTEKKPDDWVEEKRIVDESAKKPDDWDDEEDDDAVYKYEDFGFVGIDLWQVKASTIFDNIIITDDIAEADAFAAKWKALSKAELEQKAKADEGKKEEDKKAEDEDKDDDDEDEKESEEM